MIGIVIVNYFRHRLTEFCINSILNTVPRDKFRLVVIDNDSPDKSGEILKNLKERGIIDYLILNKKNMHESFALNQGIDVLLNEYFNVEYFLWMVQDFFCMKGWYENAMLVMNDLNLDFLSACFLEGLTNEKVLHSKKEITTNGGMFSRFVLRRKWKTDIGSGLLIKMDHVKKFGLRVNPNTEGKHGYENSQIEFYCRINEKLHLKGCRLYKPSILAQDPEFNNPEYIPYYKFITGMKGERTNRRHRFFMRNGMFWDPEKYYEGSNYKISKYYSIPKGVLDWKWDPEKNSENWWE